MLGWMGGWADEQLGGDVDGCAAGRVVDREVGGIVILLARCQAGWEVRQMNGWVELWLVILLYFELLYLFLDF